MTRKHYTDQEKQTIINLYTQQNLTTVEIARITNRSQSGIERFLKRSNVYVKKTHRHKISHDEDQNIIDLYLNYNWTTMQIAAKYNVTDTAILKLLNRLGVNTSDLYIRSKYSAVKHLDYFQNINTETKAYLLGFIIADGNITIPTARPNSMVFQLEIQERDKEILDLLAKEIGYPTNKIYRYKRLNPNSQATVKISFSSTRFCSHLIQLGVTPRKCHAVSLPVLPKALMPHLVRGLYDGDGSITLSSIVLYGNEIITEQVNQILLKEINVKKSAIKKYKTTCCRIGVYQYAERIKIAKYLYEDATVFLTRKAMCYSPFVENLQSKLRELLENPEEDNQQPSLESNLSEGSTTSSHGPSGTMKDHERGASYYPKISIDPIPTKGISGMVKLMIGDDDIV